VVVTAAALYRLAALAGWLSAVVLVLNTLRRAALFPSDPFFNAIAPLSETAGLLALTGIYLWQARRAGVLGLVGFGLNFAGLAGAVATEVVVNYVLVPLDGATIDRIAAGPTGPFFLVTGVLFGVGGLLFAAATWRAGLFPRPALVAYGLGIVIAGLRTAAPLAVSTGGLVLVAVGTAWLAAALWSASGRPAGMPADG
jgi:hypothetical protein